jgi:hypothetical protein
MLRGAMSPEMGRAENVAKKIKIEQEMRGLHKQPLGIDVVEAPRRAIMCSRCWKPARARKPWWPTINANQTQFFRQTMAPKLPHLQNAAGANPAALSSPSSCSRLN